MSITLKKTGSNHRAFRYTQFEKHDRSDALNILGERALENLQTTYDTMKFAKDNDWGYRISSTLFPLFNLARANVNLYDLPNREQIESKFKQIRQFNYQFSPRQFRISFHPDHFNVMCSKNDHVIDRSINELQHHGWLMDEMAGQASRSYWYPLNIHMSRSSGEPQEIADKFIKNYDRLNDSVRSRLVLENEDKGVWTPDMLHELIHKPTGIPITYDNLHHDCNPGVWSKNEAFHKCCDTWKKHDVKPLFHFSAATPGAKNPRAHAEFHDVSPDMWLSEYISQPADVDWDIELKQKDYAIQRLVEMDQKNSRHAVAID